MAIITIIWHTHMDDRACKTCVALNGYIWTFDTSKGDILTDALFHPLMGIVWSMSEGSNAHARGYLSGQTNNCRCYITTDINAEDILAKAIFLSEVIKDLVNNVHDTESGSSRSTSFEDIGVDPSKYGF